MTQIVHERDWYCVEVRHELCSHTLGAPGRRSTVRFKKIELVIKVHPHQTSNASYVTTICDQRHGRELVEMFERASMWEAMQDYNSFLLS